MNHAMSWWTSKGQAQAVKRARAGYRWRISTAEGRKNVAQLVEARARVSKALHSSECKRISAIADGVQQAGPKGMWQAIRAINGSVPAKAANAIESVYSKDGKTLITDAEGTLERLWEHFADLAAEQHAITEASQSITIGLLRSYEQVRRGLRIAK